MTFILALFIGLGLAKILYLPNFLGVALGIYIYYKNNPNTSFFHSETFHRHSQTGFATFHHHLFALMGYLAKADGLISKEEITATEAIMSELGLNYSQKSLAKSSFKSGSQGLDLTNLIAYLRILKTTRPMLLSTFFHYQEKIIRADRNPRINQINILNQIKFRLYQNNHQQHHYQAPKPNHLSNAYKTLGIDAKMSYPEMKKTYQRIIGKHHPDRARTEKERLQSEAYIKKVQSAWTVIKKHQKETVS